MSCKVGFIQYSNFILRIEILEDLPNVDTVFVCCGGGGLVSGIATYMKAIKPHVKACKMNNNLSGNFLHKIFVVYTILQ